MQDTDAINLVTLAHAMFHAEQKRSGYKFLGPHDFETLKQYVRLTQQKIGHPLAGEASLMPDSDRFWLAPDTMLQLETTLFILQYTPPSMVEQRRNHVALGLSWQTLLPDVLAQKRGLMDIDGSVHPA